MGGRVSVICTNPLWKRRLTVVNSAQPANSPHMLVERHGQASEHFSLILRWASRYRYESGKDPGFCAQQTSAFVFLLWLLTVGILLCVAGCFVVWRVVLCSSAPAVCFCHLLILMVLTVLKLYWQFTSIYPKQEKLVGVGSGDQSLSFICWTMSFYSHWWASCLWWVTDSPVRHIQHHP